MYLTKRGWVLFFVLLLLTLTGLAGAPAFFAFWRMLGFAHSSRQMSQFTSIPVLFYLSAGLLAWFLWEWVRFALRCRFGCSKLQITRTLGDARGQAKSLWAGKPFSVQLHITHSSWLGLPYLIVEDRVPCTAELLEGETQGQVHFAAEPSFTLNYRLCAPGVGRVRFEGVCVRWVDLQGFFYRVQFLRLQHEVRVLPVLVDELGQSPSRKRMNLLPPPGVHRLRQPGSGSELHDLRDYVPGDSPRSIAWKVSARRDKLITKEFESEVPLRCILFIDTSCSVRLGPPGKTALGRLVEVAGAVAQANSSVRDLTGLVLFDEHQASVLRPARTTKHLAEMLRQLTDAAGLPTPVGEMSVRDALEASYTFAKETYPEQMSAGLNYIPFGLAVNWPSEHVTGEPIGRFRKSVRAAFSTVVTLLYFAMLYAQLALVGVIFGELEMEVEPEILEYLPSEGTALLTVLAVGLLLFMPFYRMWTRRLPWIFAWQRRRLAQWRKQVSLLLVQQQQLPPTHVGLLMEDSSLFAQHAQQFLADHQVPFEPRLYDRQGRYLFAGKSKVKVLADQLLQAMRQSHDNELYVVFADLLELTDDLEPVLAAVRLALARHHQVLVISPWPPGLPVPTEPTTKPLLQQAQQLGEYKQQSKNLHRELLRLVLRDRLNAGFFMVKQAFGKLGVPVLHIETDQTIPLILQRLERLRSLRLRR